MKYEKGNGNVTRVRKYSFERFRMAIYMVGPGKEKVSSDYTESHN